MRQVILCLLIGVVMFFVTVAPVSAGSLLLGRETNPPSANPPDVLEKVCVSTTEHGDAVTHADAGGLSTSTSEDCSS